MTRMMRRQEIIAVVNRTTRPLEVMDDGIAVVIKPGYRRLEDGRVVGAGPNGQPEVVYMVLATANRAMDQNKARGSVNPDDSLDCVFLIGRVGTKDDITFVDDDPDPNRELMDRSLLPEAQRAQKLTIAGGRRTRRDRNMGSGLGQHLLALENGQVRTGIDRVPGSDAYVAPDA
jgi:hypothetical protein